MSGGSSSWAPRWFGRLASRPVPNRSRAAGEVTEAERSRPFQILVRIGFLARGLTYGLIGALAIALACGAGTAGAAPDQQGALTLIARAPLGFVALQRGGR